VVTRKGRLCLAPDDYSVIGCRQANRTAPLPRLVTGIDARPVPQAVPEELSRLANTHPHEGVDMQQSTRGSAPVDSRPRSSGVKITPPTHAGPVTTTHTVA